MITNANLYRYVQALQQQTKGWPQPLARRHFLQGAMALAAGNILLAAPMRAAHAQVAKVRFTGYPFTLGVASGSPRADSVVLWTRLAPEPLAVSGDGGVTPGEIPVQWEIAEDEQFQRIVNKGTNPAVSQLAHSVHVEVSGLQPSRWYFYRFMAGNEVSPTGRTRTADVASEKLRFAFASCQQYEQGFFSAYRHMAKENLDLVCFLGDYIYEATWGSNFVRRHAGDEVQTLAQYRVRYGQYKCDADLQAMHQQVPWIVTWDDHEVSNDYANDQSEFLDPQALVRRAAAYQAYYEHMPLERSALPKGPDMRLFNRYSFGPLAQFHVVDDRQYRSHQVCPLPGQGGSAQVENCAARLDPALTLLGDAQEKWLLDGLAASRSTWNVLAQQTLMAQLDRKPGPGQKFWTDGWDGYPAARGRITNFLAEKNINNTVVIGGDVHANFVADLKTDFDDPRSRTVASEFCGTSISAQTSSADKLPAMMPDNPHIHLAEGHKRGYVVMELGKSQATAELRVIDSEKIRDSKISTLAKFAVAAGKPGVQKI